MIKFKMGSVESTETGQIEDIVVKSTSPNSLKDIVIGGIAVIVGIGYIAVSAFKNGAKAMETAELKALDACGLIKKPDNTQNQ
jgi:hypothetical protein